MHVKKSGDDVDVFIVIFRTLRGAEAVLRVLCLMVVFGEDRLVPVWTAGQLPG